MTIKKDTSASVAVVVTMLILALVVAALYFGKEILLPLALAALLSFVLTPLVTQLERLRLGRVASVLVVTILSFSAIAGVGWIATNQVVELSSQLPDHKDNLIEKIRSVRRRTSGKLEKAKKAIEDIGEELADGDDKKSDEENNPNALSSRWMPWLNQAESAKDKDKSDAVAVKVVELPPSPLNQVQSWLGPFVGPLSTTGIVAVLVVFMLVKREDLRNRLIQLFGTSRLYATTEALDEATSRLSRYLQMQFFINAMYGVVIAAGLSVIGIPNALLWGVFGTLLRFLPYVGPWIAAAMPITLALAVSDGWTAPLITIALFLAVELVVNNVVEPLLYGSNTGVSSFGVILAALFWTWLWGPIGLVLAMPMTVCLVVLGRYIPQLNFLAVLLGDRVTLAPHEHLYQRMLTSGDMEASTLVEDYLATNDLTDLYDEVMIPALRLAEHDRHAGLLSAQQETEVIESARELVDELGNHAQDLSEANAVDDAAASCRILCLPVRDQADETAAIMLDQLLAARNIEVELAALGQLAGETVSWLDDHPVCAVVLTALPPLGSRNSRYLCKRLRRHDPNLRIIVALFGGQALKKTQQRLLDSGANIVTTNMPDTITAIKRAKASGVPAELAIFDSNRSFVYELIHLSRSR